jgi:raffinose/stachyose/melibiose transport system permease protein
MSVHSISLDEFAASSAVLDDAARVRKPKRREQVNWWATALIAVCALTVLVPLYFAIVTSLKTPDQLGGAGFGLPTDPRFANFSDAWRLTNYPRVAFNSAIITVGAVLLTLLTNSMVAYAISRNMDRRTFKALYFYFIAALFVPFPVIMLPLVILSDPDDRTLPLVQFVFQGQFNTNYTVAFASYLMALMPLVIIYLIAQRWVISGIMRGSVK